MILDFGSNIFHFSVCASHDAKKIFAGTFYLEYRMASAYALEPDVAYIPFTSISEWTTAKSTKMDTCARIAKHLLTRDDAPEVLFEDGEAVFPPFPELSPGQVVSHENKVVIYMEFPSLGHIMRNVSRCNFVLYYNLTSYPGPEPLWH